jgi:hypothetical protein
MQEVLEQIGVSKTRITLLHLQSNGMVECYVRTIKKHLRKVASTHQRDWDERLPTFLLAYRASTNETTGVTPANMVFGQELRLPCDLMFGAPPDKEVNDRLQITEATLSNGHTTSTILPTST